MVPGNAKGCKGCKQETHLQLAVFFYSKEKIKATI